MSNLVRINIVVEGQTEETFVRDILQAPLSNHRVYVAARRVETGRKHHRIYRGGMTTYGKAKRDIQRWLIEDSSAHVTTMFDLYRLPADFPGIDQARKAPDPYGKVRVLEDSLSADISEQRFVPYIQLHEFEGLLFSDVETVDAILKVYHSGHSRLAELQQLRAQFGTPEEINEGETTAPSRRLKDLYPGYDKVAFGSRIAQHIGLDVLRRECPHFDEWVRKLEMLS